MARVEQIPMEKLQHVLEARKSVAELTETANQAATQAKLAELEFRIELQQVYLNNSLFGGCAIDIFTGAVKWPEDVPTDGKLEVLSKESLERVQTARSHLADLTKAADTAVTKAKMAELEFRIELQQIYIDNGLNSSCVVDVFTGAVKWSDPVVAPVSPTPKEEVEEILQGVQG